MTHYLREETSARRADTHRDLKVSAITIPSGAIIGAIHHPHRQHPHHRQVSN